jgi:acyl-CoA thioesterase
VARAHERIRAGRLGIYDVTVTREGATLIAEFRGHSRVVGGEIIGQERSAGSSLTAALVKEVT